MKRFIITLIVFGGFFILGTSVVQADAFETRRQLEFQVVISDFIDLEGYFSEARFNGALPGKGQGPGSGQGLGLVDGKSLGKGSGLKDGKGSGSRPLDGSGNGRNKGNGKQLRDGSAGNCPTK